MSLENLPAKVRATIVALAKTAGTPSKGADNTAERRNALSSLISIFTKNEIDFGEFVEQALHGGDAELVALAEELAKANEEWRETTENLRTAFDAVSAENERLKAKLKAVASHGGGGDQRILSLISQIERLRDQLQRARAENDPQLIEAEVQKRIAAIQYSLQLAEQRVAELTMRLEELNASLAEQISENDLLKAEAKIPDKLLTLLREFKETTGIGAQAIVEHILAEQGYSSDIAARITAKLKVSLDAIASEEDVLQRLTDLKNYLEGDLGFQVTLRKPAHYLGEPSGLSSGERVFFDWTHGPRSIPGYREYYAKHGAHFYLLEAHNPETGITSRSLVISMRHEKGMMIYVTHPKFDEEGDHYRGTVPGETLREIFENVAALQAGQAESCIIEQIGPIHHRFDSDYQPPSNTGTLMLRRSDDYFEHAFWPVRDHASLTIDVLRQIMSEHAPGNTHSLRDGLAAARTTFGVAPLVS